MSKTILDTKEKLVEAAAAAMATAFKATEVLPRDQAIDINSAAFQIIWSAGRYSAFNDLKNKGPSLLRCGQLDEIETIAGLAVDTINDCNKALDKMRNLVTLLITALGAKPEAKP